MDIPRTASTESQMAKRKTCKPAEQWIQLDLVADDRHERRLNAGKSRRDLPGWIGFPIRFGVDTQALPR